MADQQTYLTAAGLDKLKAELTDLTENQRPTVIKRIKEALAHGDLSENSEYDDAKNEQAFIEGRISELERLLQNATIVQKGSTDGTVSLGSTVKVKHNGDQSTFTIVGHAEADPTNGMISNESPIGQALLGKAKGEEVTVETPRGSTKYAIVSVGA